MDKTNIRQLAYSVREVSAMTGMSLAKTYQAVATGDIPSVRIGGRILIPASRLEAMFGAQELESATAS